MSSQSSKQLENSTDLKSFSHHFFHTPFPPRVVDTFLGGRKPIYVNMLRDPADRAASWFNFMRTNFRRGRVVNENRPPKVNILRITVSNLMLYK